MDAKTKERDAIRLREIAAVLGKFMRVRPFILATAAVGILLIVGFSSPLNSILSVVAVLVLIGIAVFDYRRIDNYRTKNIPLDLAIIVSVQTLMIFLTGGAESPMIFIYIADGFLAGVALGIGRPAFAIAAYLSVLLWSVVLLGFVGLVPRTVPALLHLDHAFVANKLYVSATAGVVNLIALVGLRIGALIHDTVDRMIDAAIGARQNALAALTERNRELMDLSSSIAHELKNPLASVQGLVQLLKRSEKNAEERFEVLEREVARMRDTLDGFLNFSRPLSAITPDRIEVRNLMEELTHLHDGLTESREISVRLPDESQSDLVADERKISQALVNLLQNAIEAVPDGGKIEWVLECDGDWIEIGTSDNGPGVEPSVHNEISKGVVATTKPNGSGIGLQVVRAIAAQHGGALEVDNRPEGGCRVVMRLPRSPKQEEHQ